MLLPIFSTVFIVAGILNDVALGVHMHHHRRAHHRRASGCTVNGVSYPEGHTMCLPSANNVDPKPLSAADQKAVVEAHNKYRSGVDPKASDMIKMYWDDDIATVAQKWAETCPPSSGSGAHDSDRSVPAYGIAIGQNGAFGNAVYTDAVDNWYGEVKDFTYNGANVFDDVGHFTQVVAGHSGAVGCGAAYCPGRTYKNVFFCNYAFGQQGTNKPYTSDSAGCSNTCGSNCVDDLCDCGDKMCLNGGTMDLATCTCKCFSLFTGDNCENLNCPDTEPSCQNWGNSPMCTWPATRNDCAFTCGLCERPCNGLICQNGGTLDTSSCTCKCPDIFSGDTCEKLNCPATAETFCGYNTIYCDFMEAKVACPYTCGLCP